MLAEALKVNTTLRELNMDCETCRLEEVTPTIMTLCVVFDRQRHWGQRCNGSRGSSEGEHHFDRIQWALRRMHQLFNGDLCRHQTNRWRDQN